MTEDQREPLPRPLLASLQPLPHDRLEPAAARRPHRCPICGAVQGEEHGSGLPVSTPLDGD